MRLSRSRLVLILLVIALAAAGGFGFFTYQVRQVPRFYRQAIASSPTDQAQASEQFESQAIELQNQIRRTGDWRFELAADEVNGWLATVLPRKFPQALPREIHDPRVAIEQDRLLAACGYEMSGVHAVVSVELEPYLTSKPNELAVRVHRVAAGALPVPLGQYLDQITSAAAEHGIVVRWQEIDGDPLALVTLVPADPREKRTIEVRTLEVLPGKLVVTGTAEAAIAPARVPPEREPADQPPLDRPNQSLPQPSSRTASQN